MASEPKDPRTLVCVVRELPGRVFSFTISAKALAYKVKVWIEGSVHDEMFGQGKKYDSNKWGTLGTIDYHLLDAYSTEHFPGGWARLNHDNCVDNIDAVRSIAPLKTTQALGFYFSADIPAADSGVVHIVAEVSRRPLLSVAPHRCMTGTPFDKPTSPDREEEVKRYNSIQEWLGLFVAWDLEATDFCQSHAYPDAKWLQYERYAGERCSRVFIGDTKTWRDLYLACNEAVLVLEGFACTRWVCGFRELQDGTTIEILFDT